MTTGSGQAVATVLVVDPDEAGRSFLVDNLVHDRFAPAAARSADEALGLLGRTRPDAAIVDVDLPGRSGLDLLAEIRGATEPLWDTGMPVILTSRAPSPHGIVRGIERGADDYVAKPFHYPELVARLGCVLRRARGETIAEAIRVGPLVVDRHARSASVNGRRVALSAKEFALLAALSRDPRRVVTKNELLRDVWGYIGTARTRTVDSHASRLRRKLAECGAGERFVANVWGVGYRLLPDDA